MSKKKKQLPEQFSFLQSTRFWKLVIVAILGTMQSHGYINGELANSIATIIEFALGGSVVLRTIDKTAQTVSGKK